MGPKACVAVLFFALSAGAAQAELPVRDVERERKQARDRCDPQSESAPGPDDRLVT